MSAMTFLLQIGRNQVLRLSEGFQSESGLNKKFKHPIFV